MTELMMGMIMLASGMIMIMVGGGVFGWAFGLLYVALSIDFLVFRVQLEILRRRSR